ncbi:glycosyltransferase [Corynebacterium hansenii]|uniref:Glycosyltransferase n=1 Tax=Corynebacterium hansenii TaxID=394964 RepID=A0ABV7ZNS6_9CORY|nr:glycosyltransferase [Corynebacterium hansenii]WJZ00404.1 Alpha-monoglucosyldiacylglycerol synthase [Corynebacterium hansenii]
MQSVRAAEGTRSLRVLLLSDCWSPTINGVVRSVSDLRDGLAAAGHDVRVLTVGDSLATSFRDGVYRMGSLPAGAVYPHARIGRPSGRRVRRHIEKWAPDVVHSHTEFPAFLWARSVSRRASVPHVHTYHTAYEDYTHYFCPSRRVGRAMTRAFTRDRLRRTDRVIAPTEKVADLLRGYGVTNPLEVVGTGVDLDRFRPDDDRRDPAARAARMSELGLDPATPTVLTVGRLAAEKNLPETLDLLVGLENTPWQWLVVGDGPDAGRLREYAARLGVSDRVHIIGAVPADEVHRCYGLGDVFVTSSRSETQGLTCLEALSSGVPAVCPDDEAFRGVIADGVNGHRYRGPEDFREVMSALLTDPDLRDRMSAKARDSARDRGRDRFIREVVGAYDRAIADAPADAPHVGGDTKR